MLAAGLLAAQTPTPAPAQGPGWKGARRGPGRLAQALNLTDDQKAQAKQIFQAAAEASKPLHTQMQQARQALNDAVKNGAVDAQVDRLAQDVGRVSGDLAAARAKAFGKFYQILTPEQKQKLDQMGDRMKNREFRPAGFGPRGRGGRGGAAVVQ